MLICSSSIVNYEYVLRRIYGRTDEQTDLVCTLASQVRLVISSYEQQLASQTTHKTHQHAARHIRCTHLGVLRIYRVTIAEVLPV